MKNKIVMTFSFFVFYFFIVDGLLLPGESFAQVSISNTGIDPDSSAMLDVSATNKGILIPRVALINTSSSTPIENPTNSLLLYNTASVNDVTPGFYFWDSINLKWTSLKTQHGAGNIAFMHGTMMLKTDGTVWVAQFSSGGVPQYLSWQQANQQGGWDNPNVSPVPIPVSDIVSWQIYYMVDNNGNHWEYDYAVNDIWVNFGPLP